MSGTHRHKNVRMGTAPQWVRIAGACMLAVGSPVWAQVSTPVASQAQTPELTEIIVTAERRSESLQKVPSSISVITAAALEDKRIESFADIPSLVPNLQTTEALGGGDVNYSLRGVSLISGAPNQQAPIAVYYDEVYKGSWTLQALDLFDLERVEVLRGPQGTLYGMNASGGAINFIARVPDQNTEGFILAGGGNYGRAESQGAFQTPITDDLSVRLAYTALRTDGYIKNIYPGQPDGESTRNWGARTTFKYTPTASVEFVLRLSASNQDGVNLPFIDRILPPGPGVCGGAGSGVGCLDTYYRAGVGPRQVDQNFTPEYLHANRAIALTSKWHATDTIDLISVTSFDYGQINAPSDSDGSPYQIFEVPLLLTTEKQYAEDLRVASQYQGPFNFIVGTYFNYSTSTNSSDYWYYELFGGPCIPAFFSNCQTKNSFYQTMTTEALYSDASYKLTDIVTFHGGIRYTNARGDQKDYNAGYYNPDGSDALATIVDGRSSYEINNVSGTGGVDFQLTSTTMLYGKYSRGFRGPAFSDASFDSLKELAPAPAETVQSYEAGFKTQWLDRRLTLNGASYYYTYKNQQTTNVVGPLLELASIPRTRIVGGELELNFAPVSYLRFNGGVGYTDSRILEGAFTYTNSAGVTGPTSVVGNQLPQASKWSVTGGAEVDVMHNDAGTLTVGADAAYRSKVFFDIFDTEEIAQGGYTLLNTQIRYTDPQKKWAFTLWGHNVTDKYYLSQAYFIPSFGFSETNLGDPRTYGLTAQYNFR